MTQLGSFSVTQSSPFDTRLSTGTFNFAVCNFDPPGTVPDQIENVLEELKDNGVSGRRWRLLYQQYSQFRLKTVADSTSYANGIAQARLYRDAIGCLGTLTITLDGTNYTWRNVKVLACIPRVAKGILTGNGASSGSAVVIAAEWAMVMADISRQGSNQ